ncbi:MAG: hypothetical protein P8Z80_18865 [Pseudolabrys sp.]
MPAFNVGFVTFPELTQLDFASPEQEPAAIRSNLFACFGTVKTSFAAQIERAMV